MNLPTIDRSTLHHVAMSAETISRECYLAMGAHDAAHQCRYNAKAALVEADKLLDRLAQLRAEMAGAVTLTLVEEAA